MGSSAGSKTVNLAGLVGLAVTYALALSSALAVFCIWRCFLGIYIVAVERIKQYLDLPAEAPAVIESHRPPPEWPSNGEVCLDHVEVSGVYQQRHAFFLSKSFSASSI
jgi:ABC-type multidrug transport system fused ATPase/permease subunit